ncbi:mitotic chromosome segregation protein Csi2 [Schizosaccharomyces osmophilus]|uniref:Mitotic chromosome segregation protein Csi2 n=1 Tax=Schizosaccharomyces osmophilus TaxID=2545709 RepID=A0AAF0ATE5_9SCHI|nr:mitotic chromosome segregation protein Csi2 [Schizosaccharomyces osmophilus]WBW70667.1 mitotic chromosome segregation protein Csi2 [Schizosaccharomyces osmophilus]
MSKTSIPVSETTKPVSDGGHEIIGNYLHNDASDHSNGNSRKPFVRSHKQNGRTAKRRIRGKRYEHTVNETLLRNAFFHCIYYLRLLGWALWRSYLIFRFLVLYRKRITFITFLFLIFPFLFLTQDYEPIRLRIIHLIIDYTHRFTAIWKPGFQPPGSPFSKESVIISYNMYRDYPKLHKLLCTAISFPLFLQPIDALVNNFSRLDGGSVDPRFEDFSLLFKAIVQNTTELESNYNLLCAKDVLSLGNSKLDLLEANTQALYQKVSSLHQCSRMVNDMALYVNNFEPYDTIYHTLILRDVELDFVSLILNYTRLLPDILNTQHVLLGLVYPKGIATASEAEFEHHSTKPKEHNKSNHLENQPSTLTKFVSHDDLTNLTKDLDDARKDIIKTFESISLNNSFEHRKDLSRRYAEQTLNRLRSSMASQPNFALKAVGACIDYAWTFPKPTISEIFKEYWSKTTNVPAVLLTDNIDSCWCSTGSLVQVAIEVSKPIHISHISLLQPVHGDFSKFPEKLRIFGLLDKHTNANETLKNQESLLLLGEIPIPSMLSTISTVFHLSDYSENPDRITQLYYKSFVIQASSSKELSDSLCLYHVGVHGKEANL